MRWLKNGRIESLRNNINLQDHPDKHQGTELEVGQLHAPSLLDAYSSIHSP